MVFLKPLTWLFRFIYKKLAFWIFNKIRKVTPPLHSQSIYLNDERSILFHASSVGELEVLTPLIEKSIQEGYLVHVTIFSSSAAWALKKLYDSLKSKTKQCGYFGYSPHEGQWGRFLENINPKIVVIDRYEAWPDLWYELSQKNILLMMVGAQYRKSLFIVKIILKLFNQKPPDLYFFTTKNHFSLLLKIFPQGHVFHTGELRLDRLFMKKNNLSKRTQEINHWIQSHHQGLPVLILGSIWKEDFIVWENLIKKFQGKIFFVLAPHKLEESFLLHLKNVLEKSHLKVYWSTSLKEKGELGNSCFILNEMGVLSELYHSAQGAYIGGGFSKGVHSTLEPAVALIPIACGLKKSHLFPEIKELTFSHQLTLVQNPQECERWVESILENIYSNQKEVWNTHLKEKRGATDQVSLEIKKAFVEFERRAN